MERSSRKTRLRVFILFEIIILILTIVIDAANRTTTADPQAETGLLFFLVSWILIVPQFLGLIGMYKERKWGTVVFSISVGIVILINLTGDREMGGSKIVILLSVGYWLLTGAILALSYEEQAFDKKTSDMIQ